MNILFGVLLMLLSNPAGITLENPWIRPAASGMNSAMFVEIKNGGEDADTLINAYSDIAEVVEVHETYKKDNDMMGMRRAEAIEIAANSSLELKPRSYHIMLIKLNKDLKIGGKEKVTLEFKNAGKIEVEAEIRDMPMDHKMKKHQDTN